MKKARILVVDDNLDCLDTLAMLLEAVGYQVSTARNGHDALEVARQFRPEAVLLDLAMPVMNGYGTAQALRNDASLQQAYIAAVTGWTTVNGEPVVAAKAGFDALFVKPVDFSALSAAIDEAVARRATNCTS